MESPRRYTRRNALGLLASGGAFGLSRAHFGARAGQNTNLDAGQSVDPLLAMAVERNDTAVHPPTWRSRPRSCWAVTT